MDFSKHGNGTTSVKVHHQPGGQSSFSLAWDEGPAQKQQPKVTPAPLKESNQIFPSENDAKTSVKVRNPPGGRSNITFG